MRNLWLALPSIVLTSLLAGCSSLSPTHNSDSNRSISQRADQAFAQGQTLYGQRQYRAALAAFRDVLRWDSLRYDAHFWAGLCHYQLGEYRLEIAEYSLCRAINPNFAPVWRNLGDVYYGMDDLAQAKAAYVRYLQWEPNDPSVTLNLAVVEYDLQNVVEAKRLCRHFLTLNPTNERHLSRAKAILEARALK